MFRLGQFVSWNIREELLHLKDDECYCGAVMMCRFAYCLPKKRHDYDSERYVALSGFIMGAISVFSALFWCIA